MYTRDAVNALVISLKHPQTRVPAAIALLDRGWGKPDINVHTKNESTVLHLIAAQGTQILEAIAPQSIEYEASEQPKE